MATLKCKMCGGSLEILDGATVCVCEYCGSQQTIPNVDDEKKVKLFERANSLRISCEFDRAYSVYESIVDDFPSEAEAYWGLILCKYGIEYVDDPKTKKKIPTCHRSSFVSVFDDKNFDMVMKTADVVAKSVYTEEAKQIEEVRKGILEKSSKEEPYDIFICYKESAENGERTVDSVIAQDIYSALTKEGYRVFFARLTLERRLGCDYEPIIFSALHSSKVMLAVGTTADYYQAVWVKNEWSRYLKLIEAGEKKTLIPCYKGIDAYDLPNEFKHLQAQDMGKIGAIQDLLYGIEKIIGKKKEEKVVVQNVQPNSLNSLNSFASPLVTRGMEFLNKNLYEKATEFFDKALDYDPQNEQALLGKMLILYKVPSVEALLDSANFYADSIEYTTLVSFCSSELKERLENGKERIYENSIRNGHECLEKNDFRNASYYFDRVFKRAPEYEDAIVGKLLVEYKVKSFNELFDDIRNFASSQNYKNLTSVWSSETKKLFEDGLLKAEENTILKGQAYLFSKDFFSADDCFDKVLASSPNNEDALLGKLFVEQKVKTIEELLDGTRGFTNSPTYKKLTTVWSNETKELFESEFSQVKETLEKSAEEALKTGDFAKASSQYKKLANFVGRNEKILLNALLADCEAKSLEELESKNVLFVGLSSYSSLVEVCSPELKKRLQTCIDKAKDTYYHSLEGKLKAKDFAGAKETAEKILNVWQDDEKAVTASVLARYEVSTIDELFQTGKSIKATPEGKRFYQNAFDKLRVRIDEYENKLVLNQEKAEKNKKKRKIIIIVAIILCAAIAITAVLIGVLSSNSEENGETNQAKLKDIDDAIEFLESHDFSIENYDDDDVERLCREELGIDAEEYGVINLIYARDRAGSEIIIIECGSASSAKKLADTKGVKELASDEKLKVVQEGAFVLIGDSEAINIALGKKGMGSNGYDDYYDDYTYGSGYYDDYYDNYGSTIGSGYNDYNQGTTSSSNY